MTDRVVGRHRDAVTAVDNRYYLSGMDKFSDPQQMIERLAEATGCVVGLSYEVELGKGKGGWLAWINNREARWGRPRTPLFPFEVQAGGETPAKALAAVIRGCAESVRAEEDRSARVIALAESLGGLSRD